ncbi:hypothetical protein S101447_00880 [Acetobacter ascendens]|uniref:Uncharacterized protein n=1 Tax=Acetobacter ascendens TaxID=481146 RepID=A0A1Y0UVP3_9PROT|nr:hypothetical protein S101447_00880 [Acetobacter ascendens]
MFSRDTLETIATAEPIEPARSAAYIVIGCQNNSARISGIPIPYGAAYEVSPSCNIFNNHSDKAGPRK